MQPDLAANRRPSLPDASPPLDSESSYPTCPALYSKSRLRVALMRPTERSRAETTNRGRMGLCPGIHQVKRLKSGCRCRRYPRRQSLRAEVPIVYQLENLDGCPRCRFQKFWQLFRAESRSERLTKHAMARGRGTSNLIASTKIFSPRKSRAYSEPR